jgi:AbrB family looped-hinge helix DNA binding protein
MPTATVTSKGQITIPSEVRKALKLKAGDRVDFFKSLDGEYVLFPKNRSIRELEGCVPKLDYVPTIEELNEAVGGAVAESFRRSVGQTAEGTSNDEAA